MSLFFRPTHTTSITVPATDTTKSKLSQAVTLIKSFGKDNRKMLEEALDTYESIVVSHLGAEIKPALKTLRSVDWTNKKILKAVIKAATAHKKGEFNEKTMDALLEAVPKSEYVKVTKIFFQLAESGILSKRTQSDFMPMVTDCQLAFEGNEILQKKGRNLGAELNKIYA